MSVKLSLLRKGFVTVLDRCTFFAIESAERSLGLGAGRFVKCGERARNYGQGQPIRLAPRQTGIPTVKVEPSPGALNTLIVP